MKKLKSHLPAIIWALFILALSIGPSPNIPNTIDFEPDKLVHAFVYGVLVYLALKSFSKADILSTRNIILIVFLSAFYGLLLEIVQKTFFPYRYFEWGDAIANTIGSILGWIVFRYFSRQKLV